MQFEKTDYDPRFWSIGKQEKRIGKQEKSIGKQEKRDHSYNIAHLSDDILENSIWNLGYKCIWSVNFLSALCAIE